MEILHFKELGDTESVAMNVNPAKEFLNTYIFNNNIKTGDRSIIKLGMYVGQHLICA